MESKLKVGLPCIRSILLDRYNATHLQPFEAANDVEERQDFQFQEREDPMTSLEVVRVPRGIWRATLRDRRAR